MCGRCWQAILEGKFGASKSLSAKDMAKLLKYGAYDIMNKDADDASRRFCEEDIEAILTHRSSKISHEKQVSEGGSSFSKATFVHSSDDNSRVFWKSLLPDAATRSASHTDELLVDGPRARKQIMPQMSRTSSQPTASLGNDDDADGGSSGSSSEDEDRPKKKKLKLKQEQPSKAKQWAKAERDRLLKAILLLGRDRWDDVFVEAKIKRPQDEVTSAGKALVAKIEEPQNSDTVATPNTPTAGQTEQVEDVFAEPKFVEALKQQAKSHIEKLDAMALIAKRISVVVSAEDDAKKTHVWIGRNPSDSKLSCLGSPAYWCTSPEHSRAFPQAG
jgi:hypothetical protein